MLLLLFKRTFQDWNKSWTVRNSVDCLQQTCGFRLVSILLWIAAHEGFCFEQTFGVCFPYLLANISTGWQNQTSRSQSAGTSCHFNWPKVTRSHFSSPCAISMQCVEHHLKWQSLPNGHTVLNSPEKTHLINLSYNGIKLPFELKASLISYFFQRFHKIKFTKQIPDDQECQSKCCF